MTTCTCTSFPHNPMIPLNQGRNSMHCTSLLEQGMSDTLAERWRPVSARNGSLSRHEERRARKMDGGYCSFAKAFREEGGETWEEGMGRGREM